MRGFRITLVITEGFLAIPLLGYLISLGFFPYLQTVLTLNKTEVLYFYK